jgi:hypothetical protein
MKTHGDPGWESFPSYLDIVVPRALKFLEERDLNITFFIVGQDAALEKNHAALKSIADAGHEIGNHSFHHEPWVHLCTEEEFESELALAEEHIRRVTKQMPVGFRGPGYSLSDAALRVLGRRGYRYDASTLPTFIGPLGRLYYFAKSKLNSEEKQQRDLLFGTFQDGLRPLRPYWWRIEGAEMWPGILEIPVTTMPVFRVPIHVSYVLFLSVFSPILAMAYFRTALSLCRIYGVQPSLLLHPLDFLGSDDTSELSFFPAMSLPMEKKVRVVSKVVDIFCRQFTVVTLQQHAREVTQMSKFLVLEPNFGHAAVGAEGESSI